jgi:hypothetical protein
MHSTICHIRTATHSVHVSQDLDTGTLYCFKYTDQRCDYDQFESSWEATEYVLEPFPSQQYYVDMGDQE